MTSKYSSGGGVQAGPLLMSLPFLAAFTLAGLWQGRRELPKHCSRYVLHSEMLHSAVYGKHRASAQRWKWCSMVAAN